MTVLIPFFAPWLYYNVRILLTNSLLLKWKLTYILTLFGSTLMTSVMFVSSLKYWWQKFLSVFWVTKNNKIYRCRSMSLKNAISESITKMGKIDVGDKWIIPRWCFWLYVGDNFWILMTEFRYWWHILDVGARRLCT